MSRMNVPVSRISKTNLAVLLSTAFLLVGCEIDGKVLANYTTEAKQASQAVSAACVENPGQGRCVNEKFRQPDANSTKDWDILFVVDTSKSLARHERQKIADNIDALLGQLPGDTHFKIGVLLAHGSKSKYTGRLYSDDCDDFRVLDSATMSMATIRANLKDNLSDLRSDGSSDGGEEGMYSFLRAITGEQLKENRNLGFFRDDAGLAVVFLSDENDICAAYPSGVTPVKDPENREAPAKARDCDGIMASKVVESIEALQNGRPYLLSAIVYNDPATVPKKGGSCRNESEYGYGYMDLVELSRGISVDLADPHTKDGMTRIGAGILARSPGASRLQTEFELPKDKSTDNGKELEIDPDTIEVSVDGKKVPFQYDPDARVVRIAEGDAGQSGSWVKIHFCYKKDPGGCICPSAGPSPYLSPVPYPSAYPSAYPSPYLSPVPYPSAYPSAYPSPYLSPVPSPSAYPSAYPSPYLSPVPYPSAYPSVSPYPSPVPYPSPYPSVSPYPSPVPYPSPYPSVSPYPSPVPYPSAYPSPYPSPVPYPSPYPSPFPSYSPPPFGV